jgi:hypothetical protein
MSKKMYLMGMMVFMLFMVAGNAFAQRLVADLGDVRIYKINGQSGSFYIESDRANQTIPLKFYKSAGWIEIVCSSYSQRVVLPVANKSVSYAVEYVVLTYLGGSTWASKIASEVASWAFDRGVDYLCN